MFYDIILLIKKLFMRNEGKVMIPHGRKIRYINFRKYTDTQKILIDIAVTAGILLAATIISFILKIADNTAAYAPMIFILAVFLISKFTNRYVYGIVSSPISVLIVNCIFTYPYFKFNFTLSGYPVCILCMLMVSIITSAMTTQNKQQEIIRIESEREKTRSNLLRAVSHDLRTPLTSIEGACSAIVENDDLISKEERIKLLNEVISDSRWLIRVFENLLSITRIDGENTGISKKLEPVEEVIADSISKFKKQFPDMTIKADIPSELIMIPMDVILIEQVMMNIFENAVVHSVSATEITASVTVMNDYVQFSVADNGNGISRDILPHIFDGYFSKTFESRGDSKRNMGIGLSVCNTIIKAHGGTMYAENIKSGGAKFTFTLPAGEENHDGNQLQYSNS